VEDVTWLETGVADADDAADVGFVNVESAFAAVLLPSISSRGPAHRDRHATYLETASVAFCVLLPL
jgi:hypothetical protein